MIIMEVQHYRNVHRSRSFDMDTQQSGPYEQFDSFPNF